MSKRYHEDVLLENGACSKNFYFKLTEKTEEVER